MPAGNLAWSSAVVLRRVVRGGFAIRRLSAVAPLDYKSSGSNRGPLSTDPKIPLAVDLQSTAWGAWPRPRDIFILGGELMFMRNFAADRVSRLRESAQPQGA
jgi:hypothetical protein